MIVSQRVYRTRDGRLTLDPEAAASLAAAPGDELPDEHMAPLLEAKAAPAPANKARTQGGNK